MKKTIRIKTIKDAKKVLKKVQKDFVKRGLRRKETPPLEYVSKEGPFHPSNDFTSEMYPIASAVAVDIQNTNNDDPMGKLSCEKAVPAVVTRIIKTYSGYLYDVICLGEKQPGIPIQSVRPYRLTSLSYAEKDGSMAYYGAFRDTYEELVVRIQNGMFD